MPHASEPHEKVGYKSVIDMGREASVPFPHNLCDYPTKILPQVMGEFVERLSAPGELVLKPNRYCAVFVADYRIARSRLILPLHADVIGLMQARGFDLFDLYVWRYYRSGGFRPFGAKPYQAMNVHSYILVFHKPVAPKTLVKNRPVRYRPRLIEKLQQTTPRSAVHTLVEARRRLGCAPASRTTPPSLATPAGAR